MEENLPVQVGESHWQLKKYLPLYRATFTGNWEAAKAFFDLDPDALTSRITIFSETALHVAATAGHVKFVEELLECMPKEALAFKDFYGDTALKKAVIAGNTRIVKAIVSEAPVLPQITDSQGFTPLFHAVAFASHERKEMVRFLVSVTRDQYPSPFTVELFFLLTLAGFFDISLHLLEQNPHLTARRDEKGNTILDVMACQPSAFRSGCHLNFWQQFIYSFIPVERRSIVNNKKNLQQSRRRDLKLSARGIFQLFSIIDLSKVYKWLNTLTWQVIKQLVPGIKRVYEQKLMHVQALELLYFVLEQVFLTKTDQEIQLFFCGSNFIGTAVKSGIIELVVECIQFFPDLIWTRNIQGRNLLHLAVEYRQEKIFNLINGMCGQKTLMASCFVESNNNILHLAAKLAPSAQLNSISGAALQMQRELQWYREVEKIMQPQYKDMENSFKTTARALFREEHKELVEKGEKWMKDTAHSCMVVAALIATVVFASAFTLPGGNINDKTSEDNGLPIFLHKNTFMLFVISDGLSLFSSLMSVLTFLSILTSRYAEEDFLELLPKRLIIGLTTLFFSIITMMVAFSAALSLVLSCKLNWVLGPIALIACVPVIVFALLQFPLFVQIASSTYGSGIFQYKKHGYSISVQQNMNNFM